MTAQQGKGRTNAPAAGGGYPGTNTVSESSSDAAGALAPAAAGGDPAAESAAEDHARRAESLIPPGGSLGEVVAGQLDEAWPTITHLRVRALHDGFRRCGRVWTVAEQEVDVGEFTDVEIERLLNEPALLVMPVSAPLPEIE